MGSRRRKAPFFSATTFNAFIIVALIRWR